MRAFLARLNAWPVRQRAAILEAAAYLVLVTLWLVLLPAESKDGLVFGNLAVAAPAAAAFLQILFSIPSLTEQKRRAWFLLAMALVGWTWRHFVWIFYGLVMQSDPPLLSVADLFGLLAYPFAAYGLLRLSPGLRHAPARFRFLLDTMITSGVVVTMGLLFLARAFPLGAIQLVPTIYPIADFVLLMIVINLALAGLIARRSAGLLGLAFIAMGVSDYAYGFLSLSGSYHTGTITSPGWIAAYLLIGIEVIRERSEARERPLRLPAILDLSSQLQNILPVTMVLGLAWYVFTDWRLSGRASEAGFLVSVLFIAILIVRLGIRAGEVELQKYWQLFSSLAEPAFICDSKGTILLSNPALNHLQAVHELTRRAPQNLSDLFGGKDVLQAPLGQATRTAITLEANFAGNQAPYLLTLSPISADGSRKLIAGVAHDLSEQKRQQNAIRHAYSELQAVSARLEDMNAELEQRVQERTRTLSEAYSQLEEQHRALQELDRLKTDFVSMVSHELRTPLNNLGGGVELLLSKRSLAGSEQGTLELMQAAIQRLTRFVENILNLSAMEAGRLVLHPVPVSPAVLVEEVMRKRPRDPGFQRFQVDVPADLPLVLADESVVESVLHHLLDNALKYAPEGPILLEARPEQGGVRLQVSDEGPGIPQDKQRLLFQKFQRLETADSQEVYGYGLGLYLSRRLLGAMQSDLVFEPGAQGGSCFHFHLKAAK